MIALTRFLFQKKAKLFWALMVFTTPLSEPFLQPLMFFIYCNHGILGKLFEVRMHYH